METDRKKEGTEQKGNSGSKGRSERASTSADIHNIKPRDVSKNALKWDSSNKIINTTSKIFTKLSFATFPLHTFLIDLLQSPSDSQKKGFGLPTCTTIQAKSIPLNIQSQRNNVLMKSQTGSGKTLAYLIPVINELMQITPPIQREDGTRALIIVPTRELCNQIGDIVAKLTQCYVRIVSGSISGGEKRKSEKARLRKGVVVLVSTPGRLLDHIRFTESFNLTNLRWIIMDEIDRLLDMGFEQTILEILSRIKGERLPGLKDEHLIPSTEGGSNNTGGAKHNLTQKWSQQNLVLSKKVSHPEELRYVLASATLSDAVKKLAWPIMRKFNPSIGFAVVDGDHGTVSFINQESDLYDMTSSRATVAPLGVVEFPDNDDTAEETPTTKILENEQVDAPTRLSQYSMIVPCKWRLSALLSFLYLRRHQKVIVFFSTCDSVDYHALLFQQITWPTSFNTVTFTPHHQLMNNENNGLTFTSFDEVNWQEHVKTVNEINPIDTDDDENERAPRSSGGNQKSPTKPVSTTLDPLNWKFTGVFGKDCPMFRLHGKVPQSIRKLVYKEFSKASKGILLCTDVAARGLDLPKVDYILQYDPPCETMDYIHRIGRTARCGLAGSALLFLLPSEQLYLNLLSSYGLQLLPLSSQSMFGEISKEIPGITSKNFKNYEEIASVVLQKTIEETITQNKLLQLAGIQSYHSYLRAYMTHSNDSKNIFKLNLLHLGHVAKSFGLKETPKEFQKQQPHQSADIIGKIFNGDYASKQFKQALLPKKSNVTNGDDLKGTEDKKQKKKAIDHKRKRDDQEIDEENEEVVENEDEVVDTNEGVVEEDEYENDFREESDNEDAKEEEEDDEEDSARKEVQAKKKKKNSNSSNDDSIYVLGKRKLSFGTNQSQNKKKRLLTPSGKFRVGGSYFRKKLRKQINTEFSA